MRAVILAGGLGMRLRPYTMILPKPLVPVGDRPILEHIFRRLAMCGVTSIDICVGHLGELIQVYFSQQVKLPSELELRWHREDEPLGTAGALKIVPNIEQEAFIAMNGDVLTTLDYRELVAFHRQQRAILTVATQSKRVDIDLGVIETRHGFITDYREKPSLDYQVSMGIYVYEPDALRYLPEGPCQFPDLVVRLLEAGETVAAFPSTAEWFDIGTFQEYERAIRALDKEPEKFGFEPGQLQVASEIVGE
jgi:NDP-sugar pyrophosphorylase family protein